MADSEIINYEVLGEGAALLKKKFPMIVEAYIEDAQSYVTGIFNGIERGDAKAVAQNAHPLKSASEGMGAIKVHALAKAMETDARAAAENGTSVGHLKAAAEDIKAALSQAIPLLQEYMRKHAA